MATQTINIQVKDKTAGALGNIDRRLKGIEGTMVGVNKVAGLAAGALGAIGGVNVIGSIVKTTARFQDLRTALASVTGSAREGASAFAFVSQFATQTQFGVDTLSEAFIKLKAAGIEPTQKLLTTFTDTAAVTTDQLGTLTAMTDLFARTTSGGLGLEELNRLADRGVPVFKILEEQLGITRLEVSEFGKTAEGARKITEALTTGLDASFGGATAQRANNLSTAISNMQIGFQNVQDAVGSGGFGGALTELVNLFNEALARVIPLAKQIGEDLGFGIFQATKFLRENTFELGQFIKGATILASVLGGAGLIKVLSGVATGIRTVTIAMAKNPFGLLAVGAASLITYLSMENGLGRTISQVSAVFNRLGEIASAVGTFLKDSFNKVVEKVTGAFDNFINKVIGGVNAVAEFVGIGKIVNVTSQQMRTAVGDVATQAFTALSTKVSDAVDSTIEYVNASDLAQAATEKGTALISELTKVYQDAGMSYDEATTAARQEYEATILKNHGYDETNIILPKIVSNQNKVTSAFGTTTTKTKDLAKNIDSLKDKYAEFMFTSTQLAQAEYSKDLEAFKAALDSKTISNEDYNALQLAAGKKLQDALAKIEDEKTAKIKEENQKRIRDYLNAGNTILDAEDKRRLQEEGADEKRRRMTDERIEFEKKSELEKTQFAIGQVGDALTALGRYNKRAFEAAKAFNIASAIMNTYAGATKALATYPPPFNFIAAGAVIASGFAQVAAIRSQQYTGRQRGGALQIGRETVVGEDGPEIIVPKQPSTVIPREVAEAIDGLGGGNGGENVIVNFSITTVDAEDFDQLLIKRRGTIVGIINQAMQKRGKRGVTS
jgi:hypothetical protein